MRLPKYTWTVLTPLTVVGALVVAFFPRPVAVETTPVTRGAFQQTIDKDGKTRVRQRYTVPAPTPARRAISSIGTDKPSAAKVS